jgi:PAS domain S-box-containing protein
MSELLKEAMIMSSALVRLQNEIFVSVVRWINRLLLIAALINALWLLFDWQSTLIQNMGIVILVGVGEICIRQVRQGYNRLAIPLFLAASFIGYGAIILMTGTLYVLAFANAICCLLLFGNLVHLPGHAFRWGVIGAVAYLCVLGLDVIKNQSSSLSIDVVGMAAFPIILIFFSTLISGTISTRLSTVLEASESARNALEQNNRSLGELQTELAQVNQQLYSELRDRTLIEKELRASESLYRSLIETSPDAVIFSDLQSRVVVANQPAANVFGYASPQAMVGKPIFKFVAPSGRRRVKENARLLVKQGSIANAEYSLIRRDGTIYFGEVSAALVRDTAGEAIGFIGIAKDVTEHKQTEQLVQAQRDLARLMGATISEQAVLPICLKIVLQVSGMDSGGIYLFDETMNALELVYHHGLGNDFVQTVSSYSMDMPTVQYILSGKTLYMGSEDVAGKAHYETEGLVSGGVVPIHYQGRVLGCFNIASHTLSPIPEFSRYAMETLATDVGNIVFHLRTALSLRKSQQLLAEAQRIGRIGHWEWIAPGKYLNCSAELIRILDLPQSDHLVLESTFRDLIHTQDREQLLKWDHDALAKRSNLDYEFRIILRDGTIRWLHQYAQVTYAEDGSPLRMLGTLQDITEHKLDEEALRASEARFVTIFNSSPNPIALARLSDNRMMDVNSAWEKLTGWKKDEAIGKNPSELNLWSDLSEREHLVALVKERGAIQGIEIRSRIRSGATLHQLMSAEFVTLQGEPCLLSITQDITERKRTEEALRESESLYRSLVETSPDSIMFADLEGKVITANQPALDVLGYPNLESIVGKSTFNFIAPIDRERSMQNALLVLEKGSISNVEYLIQRRDGSTFPGELSVALVRDAVGKPRGFIAITHDLSEHKQAEQALRDSETLYRSLVDTSPDAIVFTSLDGKVLMTNQKTLDMSGFSGSQFFTGTNMVDFFAPEDQANVIARIATLFEQGAISNTEYRLIHQKGHAVPVEISSALVRDADGNPRGFLGVIRDITERKRQEDQRAASLREKETLLKEIHHRVKNNLQIISSLLNLQTEYIRDPRTAEVLLDSQNRVRSMALVHERLYRSEDIARVNFAEYLEELTIQLGRAYPIGHMARFEIEATGIFLEPDTAVPCGLIVNELISNSLKYAFTKFDKVVTPCIQIRMEQFKAGGMVLSVRDNGTGLPEEFSLGKTSTLGLQLVNGLARQLGGTVEFANDHGAWFTVSFPRQ